MTRALQPFRTITPLQDAAVHTLAFSATSSHLLCAGASPVAAVLTREGQPHAHTARGDMYLVDAAHTTGHTASVLAAAWRPIKSGRTTIVTTAADATIRLWDIGRATRTATSRIPVAPQITVAKLRSSRGSRAVASALAVLPDDTVALACEGGLRVVNADAGARTLHSSRGDGNWVASALAVAPGTATAPLLAVRSDDDSLRVFDRRSLHDPIAEFRQLSNAVSETGVTFVGAGGEYLLTGTSANPRDGTKGTLRLFCMRELREVWHGEAGEGCGSVISVLWDESLNQIVYGGADGGVRVMFHEENSRRGIVDCLARSDFKKRHGVVSMGGRDMVVAGGGERGVLPVSKRARREAAANFKPTMLNEPPEGVRGKGSTTLAKHLAEKDLSNDWAKDPREAILQYADVAEKDRVFTKAYEQTQPQVLLAEKTAEQEEEQSRKAVYDRDVNKRRQ